MDIESQNYETVGYQPPVKEDYDSMSQDNISQTTKAMTLSRPNYHS